MITNKTSFWNFISKNNIEIPIIQRDYAQGRDGKEYLRRNFLTELKRALDNELDDGESILKLDFVYGTIENDKLQPLDGQQRLTTLWLIHWYIALRAGKLIEAVEQLKKFSYETRISSREFFNCLCVPEHFTDFTADNSIVDFITTRTWFYSAWKQDPTIQSMLRMLSGTIINDKFGEDIVDGIEELFGNVETTTFVSYWEKLISDDSPIAFYHLSMKEFKLSDDLYIKMNARGKQLTNFENFKADLIGYIRRQAADGNKEWMKLLDAKKGIPILLDTEWMDIFWKHRSNNNRVDEIYYAFMNRFFWNELFTANDNEGKLLPVGKGVLLTNGNETNTIENENHSYLYLNKEAYNAYGSFTPYLYDHGRIPQKFFEDLQEILHNFIHYQTELPKIKWLENFKFIPNYEEDKQTIADIRISKLSQLQRIVFFAVCKYFREGPAEETSLKRWMRIVRNIVSGQGEDGEDQIRSTPAVRTAIEYIDRLDSHNVYLSLIDKQEVNSSTDIAKRWNEEVEKAHQIMDGDKVRKYLGTCKKEDSNSYQTWEEIINDAEDWSFFKGSIRFLFHNAKGEVDWNDFDKKWENTKKLFKKESNEKESALNKDSSEPLKILFSRFTLENFEQKLWWKHRVFNNLPRTWLYFLLSNSLSLPVHSLLMGEELSPLSPNSNDKLNILYQLCCTGLLDYIILSKNAPWYWIRWYHEHLAIYPSGCGIFLNAKDRDNFLLHTEEITVDRDVIVGNNEFLFGSDIHFKYKENTYCWKRNNYIFLISQDKNSVCAVRDDAMTELEDKYYCFKYKKEENTTAQLDRLLDEYKRIPS